MEASETGNAATFKLAGSSHGSVVLIGFRGSGKSTVGRILAEALGLELADTDLMVTSAAGLTIREIFDRGGEALFRQLEKQAVKQAATKPHAVISVGGGAILDAENTKMLKACGTVIWLDAPAQVLWERISADCASSASRPNLTSSGGLTEVEALLARRKGLYAAAADIIVPADGNQNDTAQRIMAILRKRKGSTPE